MSCWKCYRQSVLAAGFGTIFVTPPKHCQNTPLSPSIQPKPSKTPWPPLPTSTLQNQSLLEVRPVSIKAASPHAVLIELVGRTFGAGVKIPITK